ncbi:MAG TPA: bifunctional isocitrate dehydrogenase kinase/phosphatase [Longimicrobium sp.]|jgi:isocitrate dehydrogenase kinase/phosphatase
MTAPRQDPAEAILAAYDGFVREFREVTRLARERFLSREWRASQEDAQRRLLLYPRVVRATVGALEGRVTPGEAELKPRFARLVEERTDAELAKTFYDSVVRRLLGSVGVDPSTQFTPDGAPPEPREDGDPVHLSLGGAGLGAEAFERLFRASELADAFADPAGDAALSARAARAQLGAAADEVRALEALPFLFYRNKGAYLVARLRLASGEVRPLVVPLLHDGDGVRPDAVLTTPDEVHVVFSFARSYFHADTGRPAAAIAFLRTLMPAKPLHELYTSIGYNKHGKTVFYRALAEHLACGEARFEPPEGARGMVMSVFTLPSFNVVFKVIKDRFGAPKQVTPSGVRQKYRLVFLLDRVGRLVDAQEFEGLQLPRGCFPEGVLDELLAEAGGSVSVEDGRVVVRHLYTERRLRPLDVYLRESDEEAAVEAVVEYGNAVKDLACANIFPGDLLLKNFGVSRHGRVIFYDYDEISLLTDVHFRSLPTARYEEDEMGAEPWFTVQEGDVFPEEFVPFLVPAGRLREAFMDVHGDLFTVRFWRGMQEQQEAGAVPDFFPYPQSRRLRRGGPAVG